MTTYTDEVNIYNPEAVADGIDDAAKTATNYIGVDSTGIRIANANPNTATTYQHQTATETEFVVGSEVVGSFGAKARIGKAGKSRVYIDSQAFAQFDDANRLMMYSHDGAIELGRWQTFVVDGTGFRVYGARGVESDYVSTKVGSTTTSKQVVKTYPVKSGETLSSVSFPLVSPTIDYVRVKSSSGTRDLVANIDYILEGDAAPPIAPIDGVTPNSRGAGVEIRFTPAISPTEDVIVEVAYTDGFVDYEMRLGPEEYTHFTVDQDSARFEATNGSKVQFDYHSMQMVDKEGNDYLHVSDLRDVSGKMTYTQSWVISSTSQTAYLLLFEAMDTDYQLTIVDSGGTDITAQYTPNMQTNYISFPNASPPIGSTITAVYDTQTIQAKAYTLGIRKSGSTAGPMSFAEGWGTEASGSYSHSEGQETTANAYQAHAEGYQTTASGIRSHAEGTNTTASGASSHAEGTNTTASEFASHAEGIGTTASGINSHAEGYNTTAGGDDSHAEGHSTTASRLYSHAEGHSTTASGQASHAEGYNTTASMPYSHAQNVGTIAASNYQTAIGKYNVSDTANTYAFIVGNGTSSTARSNAATIAWNGNYIAQAMAGIIQMFAGSTAPDGWLICDGQAVSRTTYATLFAAIGTTWGSGDGSTTFNVPDLRGRAPIGAGTGSSLTARTLGGKGGAESVTLTAAQSGLPAHTHGFTNPKIPNHVHTMDHGHGFTQPKVNRAQNAGAGTNRYAIQGTDDSVNVSAHSGAVKAFDGNTGNPTSLGSTTGGAVGAVTGGAANATSAHNNMQPFAVVNFIICTGKTS